MTVHRVVSAAELQQVLALIRAEFCYMDGIVDPPTTMHAMTPDSLAAQARTGEVWAIGNPCFACMVLSTQPGALYIGKLAVAMTHRRQRLARRLIDHAQIRAAALGLPMLELGTRVELTGNQRVFTALGFTEIRRDCHPGFARHTAIIYRRPVPPPANGNSPCR